MDLGLNGRIAVVTGASRGIGLAVVRGLVNAGAQVVAGARTASTELQELAAIGSVTIGEVDLSEDDGPSRLIALAGDRIDILVNNVGTAPVRTGGFLDIPDGEWQASLNLNLMAAVRATRSALPIMLAAGQGVIVTVSSANAFLPNPAVMDYSAAKAALANFCKALSSEVGPRGIRVNTVSPGPVATDLWLGAHGVAETLGRASGAKPEDVADEAARQMPTGRFTQPGEVADAILFLASDRAANVTGSDVRVDGGLIPTW
jgi:NAD(P)-dependent dehydrogenase (short-subunit alcohol dehydrogenase family)